MLLARRNDADSRSAARLTSVVRSRDVSIRDREREVEHALGREEREVLPLPPGEGRGEGPTAVPQQRALPAATSNNAARSLRRSHGAHEGLPAASRSCLEREDRPAEETAADRGSARARRRRSQDR